MPKRFLPRVLETRRAPNARAADFAEVAIPYTPEEARLEALRCLRCRRAPCTVACPLGTRADLYVPLIAGGRIAEAAAVLRDTDPFPAICSRVCHRPCEDVCLAGKVDAPVAIRSLKRYLVDATPITAPVSARVDAARSDDDAPRTRVAVVGSGPAGLAAARVLASLGHTVVVYEALEEPGGLLRWGIPAYRLPRSIVAVAVREAEALGVEFRPSQRLGADFTLQDLAAAGYRAVLLAIGAHRSRPLDVPGDDFPWVVSGLAFLREVAAGTARPLSGPVVVIGGGDAALDAARSARRLGAHPVSIVYRRSRGEMPARREEILEAEEEGIAFRWLAAPLSLHQDGGEQRIALQDMRLEPAPNGGRAVPVPIPDSRGELPAALVIAAVGQTADPAALPEALQRASRGANVSVDPDTFATDQPGVYACGDAIGGPATVTDAAAMGRRAAHAMHDYVTAVTPRAA